MLPKILPKILLEKLCVVYAFALELKQEEQQEALTTRRCPHCIV
jgi:hypothetical protein